MSEPGTPRRSSRPGPKPGSGGVPEPAAPESAPAGKVEPAPEPAAEAEPASEPEGMAEIKADIEATRAELSDTVDQLAHRLDVKAQVGEKAESVKETVAAKAEQVQEATPPNTAKFVAAGAAALVLFVVIRRIRKRR